MGLAAAAHQGFSCNLFTLPSDVFPRRAVGSLVGIGGTAGAIGGMLLAKYAGWVLERLGSFKPLFAYAGCAYLLALLVVHLLSPRLAPAPDRLMPAIPAGPIVPAARVHEYANSLLRRHQWRCYSAKFAADFRMASPPAALPVA